MKVNSGIKCATCNKEIIYDVTKEILVQDCPCCISGKAITEERRKHLNTSYVFSDADEYRTKDGGETR